MIEEKKGLPMENTSFFKTGDSAQTSLLLQYHAFLRTQVAGTDLLQQCQYQQKIRKIMINMTLQYSRCVASRRAASKQKRSLCLKWVELHTGWKSA